MEDSARNGLHDYNLTLASRKAEEAAWRRYEAFRWLESLVGRLGILNQPSEREFISCLRNGLVLCNAINKIQPGSVPKVVENPSSSQAFSWESQPLPAYQYFENVRNFLDALEELKLPAFEASDLERDTIEAGSAAKVVDCILTLKSYHESKQMSRRNGVHKPLKSPLVMHSAGRISRSSSTIPSDSCRRLDMSSTQEKQMSLESEKGKLEDSIVKSFVDSLLEKKENIDGNLLASFCNGDQDVVGLFKRIVSSCLEEQKQKKSPELQSALKESSNLFAPSTLTPLEDVPPLDDSKRCRACLKKDKCNHRKLFQLQEKELFDLKALLSRTKGEFEGLQVQLQVDLKDLGTQVQELSTAALGYHKVVQENRNLYNMVQDLKGNIRVYCRIRPSFGPEAKSVIDFMGQDGSLVISDPLKPQKDGRKVFQFNRIFCPSSTQDEVFKDTRPVIRSVMDGYNVCIFAYGQTGSGKTYTMSGPAEGTSKDLGINYLALNDLFHISNKRKDIIIYEIHVQMVEIYNEQVRDLLAEDSSTTKLEIRSCPSEDGLSLPNATIHTVKSTTDVLNLMKLGELNRVVSSTAMNNRSSRSHSVLTVHVHGTDTTGSTLRSCLHLIDLAGSERVDKSEVTGDRLKEAQYINRSLSCLGDVITALAQKNSHIPYRNSKLTLLLQDSLGGHAKTLMFAHVSPEEDSFGETASTLKFAQRVSTVELGAARLNKETIEVMQLKEQLETLKKALANREGQSALPINRTKDPRSPRPVIEKTPPHPRRLSIENCSITKGERSSNIPSVPVRSRRLSLEGQRHIKDNFQVITLDIEAVSKLSGGMGKLEMSHSKAPKSPTLSAHNKVQGTRINTSRSQISSLQRLEKTPERPVHATNEAWILMQNELTVSSSDYQTPNTISSTNGNGFQIRRSLRTIGKMINGSEKRNQPSLVEPRSPLKGASNIKERRSRTNRRQSLTGIQSSDRSCISNSKDTRNAKTPSPVHLSTMSATKRWL